MRVDYSFASNRPGGTPTVFLSWLGVTASMLADSRVPTVHCDPSRAVNSPGQVQQSPAEPPVPEAGAEATPAHPLRR